MLPLVPSARQLTGVQGSCWIDFDDCVLVDTPVVPAQRQGLPREISQFVDDFDGGMRRSGDKVRAHIKGLYADCFADELICLTTEQIVGVDRQSIAGLVLAQQMSH